MPTKPPIDWGYIRLQFENGLSPYKISQSLGGRPSKQGIAKRALKQGWQRGESKALEVAEALPICQRAQSLARNSLAQPERVAFILELLGRGSSERLACSAAGISAETLRQWKAKDPQLKEQVRQARAGKLAEWVGHIDKAAQSDWRAAKELLQAAPDAEDFSQTHHGGITVVLNIDRDKGTLIQGN